MKIQSLEFQNLSFGHDPRQLLFREIDYRFPAEGLTLIRGKTGSGVSTLLQILTGLIPPNEGRFLVNGRDFWDLRFDEETEIRRAIGFGFDRGGLLFNRTIYENLALPLAYHDELSHDQVHSRVQKYLEFFKLTDSRDLRPATVSTSALKACAVGRAFIHHPQVAVLDHPTEGLHRDGGYLIAELIRWHQREHGLKNVILTTDDDVLLNEFDYQVIEIEQNRLSAAKEMGEPAA